MFKKWARQDDAVAAIEAGLLFPVMIALFLGIVDVGTAITINQKVINASHTMVDLLTRDTVVDDAMLSDAVVAAQMSLEPHSIESLGYDVQSIMIGAVSNPQWNETENMDMNNNVLSALDAAGYVGEDTEGVMAVTVQFTYTPFFTNYLTGSFDMQEVSFARGRKGGFITRE